MNFLLRQSPNAAAAAATPATTPANADQLPPVSPWLKKTPSQSVTTLEGLIAEDKSHLVDHSTASNRDSLTGENGIMSSASIKDFAPLADKHVDVAEDEGWITIPHEKLPDDWAGAPDIQSFHSLDRSFVFPGEQVHILACLSASKQDTEIITPFKVAAVMNKNGYTQGSKDQNGNVAELESPSGAQPAGFDDNLDAKNVNKHQVDVSASESYLRMENHRRQVQTLLQRFKDSHFFVRISEAGELLWSDRSTSEAPETEDDADSMENNKAAGSRTSISAVIDSGRFDARASGGVARNSVKCYSLANGDIVVLLQVNVGVDSLRDPILEILQFEKHNDRTTALESDLPVKEEHSTCGELLKWLLPLDNSQLPVNRPLSPPLLNSSHKTSFSGSSGSQLFSFGHFRSYSMSSLPQNTAPSASPSSVSSASSKPNLDLEDWNRFGSQKSLKSPRSGSQGLLSFRGVTLEPERFSVCCGLEGIYIPGRRWRKQLEIIQPVDIHSFAANCNTDDMLCVQIKNICPAHVPDIVVYIDAITVILEEASKEADRPLSVPIACVEAGTGQTLPNLALRRGEEHSFILKPAISALKKSKIPDDKLTKLHSRAGSKPASFRLPPVAVEETKNISTPHKYAILISCRCNYSESRLFFKKPTDWRPRISRDFMISVASETSKQTLDCTGKVSQLPVQALTLQASNLTSEDLTLIILAPASVTPAPSVLSLNSTPSSPMSPFRGFATTQRLGTVTRSTEDKSPSGAQSLSSDQQGISVADVIPTTASSCTHLWLHSRVPLGCVPSQSTAKIKLELLPLTDGIITLDTLQIYVKETGLTYIPENALKINATSSIATGII
ncbi:hypothetical protein SOVF_032600 [Spinacia oleracea]|uniref:Uncharacterized protein n=1 Tax=Spinacia oleracea TaxID=3562 RepID=A0A9R0I8V7_SPIOL|nr:uncharacterized protein LOC110784487 [Spinacia oleracea]XP_021844639.2 uncharacterized protein LOC110784487 [Spinacia oleracea]XP_056699757.1 uncharacterized protein LOC110784487 [Spinacia oleracea]XP_056699759.1 uncharacterized protein LOC110784487 [Spinacia oleracea]KNA22632.1 hypothetical protein SOVF_032600 [Spinacia oleracea]